MILCWNLFDQSVRAIVRKRAIRYAITYEEKQENINNFQSTEGKPFKIVYLLPTDRVAIVWLCLSVCLFYLLIMPSNSVVARFPFDILFKHSTLEMLRLPFRLCHVFRHNGRWTSYKMYRKLCSSFCFCLWFSLFPYVYAAEHKLCATVTWLHTIVSVYVRRWYVSACVCVWKFISDFGYTDRWFHKVGGFKMICVY